MNLNESINELIEPSDGIIYLKDYAAATLPTPYSSGLARLDDMTLGGFRDGDLVIISGVAKMGKTSFSQQLTLNYSHQGIPVMWFSFEMTLDELKWRFEQMEEIKDLICLVPKKNISDRVDWLEKKIKEAYDKHAVKIVVIDNLDFITVAAQTSDDKLTQQKRIVGMLKKMAIENKIIIFLNCHVTKLEDGKEPRMQNVYGASETYKLADFIIFVHRVKPQVARGLKRAGIDDDLLFTNKTKIILDGNRRTGQNGVLHLIMENNKYVNDPDFEKFTRARE